MNNTSTKQLTNQEWIDNFYARVAAEVAYLIKLPMPPSPHNYLP